MHDLKGTAKAEKVGRELVTGGKKFDLDLEFFPVIRALAVSMPQTRLTLC